MVRPSVEGAGRAAAGAAAGAAVGAAVGAADAAVGVAVAAGVADGEGVAVGETSALGVGVGVAVGWAEALGVGVAALSVTAAEQPVKSSAAHSVSSRIHLFILFFPPVVGSMPFARYFNPAAHEIQELYVNSFVTAIYLLTK